jgi:hypothetical protein
VRHRNKLIGIEAVTIAILGADVFLPMIRTRRHSGLEVDFRFPWHGEGPGIVDENNSIAFPIPVEPIALTTCIAGAAFGGSQRSLIVNPWCRRPAYRRFRNGPWFARPGSRFLLWARSADTPTCASRWKD